MIGIIARIAAILAPWIILGYRTQAEGLHGGSVIIAMMICVILNLFVAKTFPIFHRESG